MSKLLILASNPRGDLKLQREVTDLINAVQRLEQFKVVLDLEASAQNLQVLLAEHSPEFVHFCGHGDGEKGLVFQDEDGREQLISTEILTRIFKNFANEIHCTVLNACESVRQAEAIVEYIDYVVGMSQPILDKAAHLFAVAFYKGLGAGKSIEQAYEMGCTAIQIWWSETHSQPNQSRQYRKLVYAGEAVQPAQPGIAEYLKPDLLRKSDRFPPNVARLGSVPGVPHVSAQADPPQEFVEFVQQEIDRKEYKDGARAAYDNFGQFSSQNTVSISKSELKQRQIFLSKVKHFWIEGFLQPSLQGVGALSLEFEARPDAISDLSQGIEALSVDLDASYERLHETRIYEEMGQGRTLLILGSPGAGKTITLLQLAQRLIERSEQNLSLPMQQFQLQNFRSLKPLIYRSNQAPLSGLDRLKRRKPVLNLELLLPMPVVFNLSSWARDQKPIFDWLIDELREKYQVPKVWSEHWIKEKQLILLLDGLDEVEEKHRNDCVRALNEFIGLFPETEVAVCSRVQEYENLTERLLISSALCLQPLSTKQVYQSLDRVGGYLLAGVKALLRSDTELERFAQTPLILYFMSVAYRGWSVEKLMPQLRSTQNREQNLFNTYIDCRLEQGATSEYSKERVRHWLVWLAKKMKEKNRTIFLIERMQPSWLQPEIEEKKYRIINFILSWLIFGAIGWGLSELFFVLIKGEEFKPLLGLSSGLSGALIGGFIIAIPNKIVPLEQLSWSWNRAKQRFLHEFCEGIVYGLVFGVIFGLIFLPLADASTIAQFQKWCIGGLISGLIGGLILGLGSGLGSSSIERRIVTNQGIRSSLRNCLIIGLFFGLIGCGSGYVIGVLNEGLISNLVFGPIVDVLGVEFINKKTAAQIGMLVFGLVGGVISGLKYGGAACIQHFILRQMLHKQNSIPWNYAKFLNFASKRQLMIKVGGGYVFFHRSLLEHFAKGLPNK